MATPKNRPPHINDNWSRGNSPSPILAEPFIEGLDGILELAGGVLLLAVGNGTITHLITWLTAPELVEDPHDLLANAILHSLHHLSADTRVFAAAYLFGHGAVKIFLVAGLWREKLWAFPTALTILSAFVFYQVYRLSQRASPSLLILSVIDLFVIVVIWREYQVRKPSLSVSDAR